MVRFANALLSSYGSFLFFRHPWANLLLVGATLQTPWTGLCGLIAAAAALASRRALDMTDDAVDGNGGMGGMDRVNGMLAGLFVGATFAPGPQLLALALFAGALAPPLTRVLHDRLTLGAGLPVLSAPMVVLAFVMLGVGRALALPFASAHLSGSVETWLATALPGGAQAYLVSMGAIYFTPTLVGGLLVLAAVLVASRALALLSLLAWALAVGVLAAFGLSWQLPAVSASATAAMVAALMAGGVFARPGRRALAVGMAVAVVAALFSLALTNALWYLALPPLSLPYLATLWLAMAACGRHRGQPWSSYWLDFPQVPERSLEGTRLAETRGVGIGSLPVRAPFSGTWDVYQGFDGPHTHRGIWRHALDFHRLVGGSAHRGDGRLLTDYYCFGAVVKAPVHGVVVACRDDLADNPPGEVDAFHPWGNHVLIQVDIGVFALLAHLQQESLTVATGTLVAPGQPVARCGNSGRSPQPHLHLHVQRLPMLGAPTIPFHLAFVMLERESAPAPDALAFNAVPRARERVTAAVVDPALAGAMHHPVGRRYAYAGEGQWQAARSWEAAVELDMAGRAWLVSSNGARIGIAEGACAAALYDRHGPADSLLDALALAAGLTPLIGGKTEWRDAPPLSLLALPQILNLVCWLLPGLLRVESHYRRKPAATGGWHQEGHHQVLLGKRMLWSCKSMARIVEGEGVSAFHVIGADGQRIGARLVSHGVKPDIGIAGWSLPARMVA